MRIYMAMALMVYAASCGPLIKVKPFFGGGKEGNKNPDPGSEKIGDENTPDSKPAPNEETSDNNDNDKAKDNKKPDFSLRLPGATLAQLHLGGLQKIAAQQTISARIVGYTSNSSVTIPVTATYFDKNGAFDVLLTGGRYQLRDLSGSRFLLAIKSPNMDPKAVASLPNKIYLVDKKSGYVNPIAANQYSELNIKVLLRSPSSLQFGLEIEDDTSRTFLYVEDKLDPSITTVRNFSIDPDESYRYFLNDAGGLFLMPRDKDTIFYPHPSVSTSAGIALDQDLEDATGLDVDSLFMAHGQSLIIGQTGEDGANRSILLLGNDLNNPFPILPQEMHWQDQKYDPLHRINEFIAHGDQYLIFDIFKGMYVFDKQTWKFQFFHEFDETSETFLNFYNRYSLGNTFIFSTFRSLCFLSIPADASADSETGPEIVCEPLDNLKIPRYHQLRSVVATKSGRYFYNFVDPDAWDSVWIEELTKASLKVDWTLKKISSYVISQSNQVKIGDESLNTVILGDGS